MRMTNISISGTDSSMSLTLTCLNWEEACELMKLLPKNAHTELNGPDHNLSFEVHSIDWSNVEMLVNSLDTHRKTNGTVLDEERLKIAKEILFQIYSGQKLNAVKMWKDATKSGLKESKDCIDQICDLSLIPGRNTQIVAGIGGSRSHPAESNDFESIWPIVKNNILSNINRINLESREFFAPMYSAREIYEIRGTRLAHDLGIGN